MKKLETTILRNLFYHEEFTRKVLPFIREDYFADKTEKIIFKQIESFVNKYNNLPTYESVVIEVIVLLVVNAPVTVVDVVAKSIETVLPVVVATIRPALPDTD